MIWIVAAAYIAIGLFVARSAQTGVIGVLLWPLTLLGIILDR